MKNPIKKLRLAHLLLFLVLVLYIGFQIYYFSELKQLPSSIFGGDLYHQLGSINHDRYGGDLLGGYALLGGKPSISPIYSIFVASIANGFNLGSIEAMFLFSIMLTLLSVLLIYYLASKLLKNDLLAVVLVVLYLPISRLPMLRYGDFAVLLVAPIFVFSLIFTLQRSKWLYAIITGVFYGLLGLSSVAGFVSSTLLIFISFFVLLIVNIFKKFEYKRILPMLIVVFIIGFTISQLYWYEPIFIQKGEIKNKIQEYSFEDLNLNQVKVNTLISISSQFFFNFNSFYSVSKTIIFVFGLMYLIYLLKSRKEVSRTLLLLAFASLVIVFSYFITIPIFGTNIEPMHITDYTLSILLPIIFTLSFGDFITSFLDKNKKKILVGTFFILLLSQVQLISNKMEDPLSKDGKNAIYGDVLKMSEWIRDNTKVNDVFLSDPQLSFLVNAFTGRKTVTSRRSQTSLFIDMDERMADTAVLLYGNNSEKTDQLIKKYNIKYLYWNPIWKRLEFELDQNNNILKVHDALIAVDSPYYREHFSKYNIPNIQQKGWLDSASKGNLVKKYDLLVVKPEFSDFPLSDTIKSRLKPVWIYYSEEENIVLASIYEIIEV